MNKPIKANQPEPPAPAYILAGGHSTRFGSDKARALITGTPMIVRIADRLEKRAHHVTVIARKKDQYADLGLSTIPDLVLNQGPLIGLRTALTHRLKNRGPGWLILCSCDLIELQPHWLQLLDTAQQRHPLALAVAWFDDRWHPFPGMYHTDLLTRAESFENGSFQSLLNKCLAVPVPIPTGGIPQANRPSDIPD